MSKALTQVLKKAALEPVFRRRLASDPQGALRAEGITLAASEVEIIRQLDVGNWSLKQVNVRLSQEGLDMITPV